MLGADVLRQFHDAVGFATQASNRRSVVQGITRDSQPIDTPEADVLVGAGYLAADDGVPRPGVDSIDDEPHADDGYEPVAGVTQVLPQLDKADVEGQQHDHAGQYADDEEQVVEPLLCPGHNGSEFVGHLAAEVLVTGIHILPKQPHDDDFEQEVADGNV